MRSRVSYDIDFTRSKAYKSLMSSTDFKNALFVLLTALVVPGCAAMRTGKVSTKTVRDRVSTAVGETAIFASETVPMAVLSPIVGVPEGQKDLKWYQRRIP